MQPLYTRSELQGLKKQHDLEEDRKVVASYINDITSLVVTAAKEGKVGCSYTLRYIHYIGQERRDNIAKAVLEDVKTLFPDTTVHYEIENCPCAGTPVKYELILDWS
jgi:hypothetical protein